MTDQLGMARVPGREVAESTATFVLMLYAHRLTRAKAAWGMVAPLRPGGFGGSFHVAADATVC